MYLINQKSAQIDHINTRTATEMGLLERNSIQKWIAKQPDILAKGLLIIQKEFRLPNTRSKVDLLALDKNGHLVIIKTKRDSSRLAIGQAVEYAACCEALTQEQIIDFFEKYLIRNQTEAGLDHEYDNIDGRSLICKFLNIIHLSERELNPANSQRLIIVAETIRPEDTNTAHWLSKRGIPTELHSYTLHPIDSEQLIFTCNPIGLTSDNNRLSTNNNIEDAEKNRTKEINTHFYNMVPEYRKIISEAFRNSSCCFYDNSRLTSDSFHARSGVSGCLYKLIFNKYELRVALCLSRGSMVENKFLFNFLYEKRDEIEKTFNYPLEWLRLENHKQSNIQFSTHMMNSDKENWNQAAKWHVKYMTKLEKAIETPLKNGEVALKQVNF